MCLYKIYCVLKFGHQRRFCPLLKFLAANSPSNTAFVMLTQLLGRSTYGHWNDQLEISLGKRKWQVLGQGKGRKRAFWWPGQQHIPQGHNAKGTQPSVGAGAFSLGCLFSEHLGGPLINGTAEGDRENRNREPTRTMHWLQLLSLDSLGHSDGWLSFFHSTYYLSSPPTHTLCLLTGHFRKVFCCNNKAKNPNQKDASPEDVICLLASCARIAMNARPWSGLEGQDQ